MIGLRIGAAELAEIEAGAPAVVLAPGLLLPHAPPLLPLVLKDGVLARPGAALDRTLPLPAWARPLAILGPEHLAEALRPLLPAGLPVLPDAAALLGLLAGALREARAGLGAAEAERDRLKRALALPAPPLPRRVLDLPPAGPVAALPLSQPLGRPAEGLCRIELHLAPPQDAPAGLVVRLLAGARVLALWRVPGAALEAGWLGLDLPEPVPPGVEQAVLEVAAGPGGEGPPAFSLSGTEAGASLALRAWAAPPGWSVLPRFLDWGATGTTRAALPLPEEVLAGAEAEGDGRLRLVAAGAEPARLLVALPPGGRALLRLPPLPVGPADLLRARLARAGGTGAPVAAELRVTGGGGEAVASGWRELARDAELPLALPLPAGPMAGIALALRHDGEGEAVVEVAGLALVAGAEGEPRRAPPAGAPAARAAIALPAGPAIAAAQPWRAGPPAPRLAAAGPGGAAPAPAMPAAPAGLPEGMASGLAFQDLKLNQHLVNAEGTYRHLDIAVTGMVSGGGLWRQVRVKLFDRRGTAGLEFREMKGWPQMFDAWPGAATDSFGPFWRLETEGAAVTLAALATPHDRAMVAALVGLLPDLAARAASLAGLAAAEQEAWAVLARRLAQAVATARGMRAPG